MKKTQTTKRSKPCAIHADDEGLDYRPLQRVLRDALEWAADVANAECDDLVELEVVERLRTAARARLGGEVANVDLEDLRFTLALVIGAIERDLDAKHVAHAQVDSSSSRHAGHSRRPGSTSWLEQYLFHARGRA